MEVPTSTGEATNSAPIDTTPANSGAGEVKIEAKEPEIDFKRKVKVKINDKEDDVTIEELQRHYQKERAADEKFRKAADQEKQLKKWQDEQEEKKKAYKANPWKAFEDLELDPDKFAEQRLLKKLELEMMSPSERRALELESENKHLRSQKELIDQKLREDQEKSDLEAKERVKSEQISAIDNDFSTAVQELNLKPTPALMESVAQYMLAHLNAEGGKHDISAKEALQFVVTQQKADMLELVQGMTPDDFMEAVKPEFRESIRKFFLKQVKNTEPRQSASTNQAKPKRTNSTDDFFKELEQKLA